MVVRIPCALTLHERTRAPHMSFIPCRKAFPQQNKNKQTERRERGSGRVLVFSPSPVEPSESPSSEHTPGHCEHIAVSIDAYCNHTSSL